MSILSTDADPLVRQGVGERPAYATGILLDAQDFTDEQTYHRGRLARALTRLAGGGTLAGLRVEYIAASGTQVEEVRVAPGLAVDRLGRVIEVPRPACVTLPRWWDATFALDGGDLLRQAAYTNLQRFISPRLSEAGLALPARAVVADVFLRFAQCPVGLTPSFALGPFDALNAVSTARIRDAYELKLVPRTGLGDSYSGLPLPSLDATALAGDAAARRNSTQDAIFAAWPGSGALSKASEQPDDFDTSAIFLARVLIPVAAANPPTRTASTPQVDNFARRFLPDVALLAQLAL